MNNKKRNKEMRWKNITRKIIVLMTFIMISVLLCYIPVMAEQEVDKATTSETGGVIFKEYPERVYEQSSVISSYSNVPDKINLSDSPYFPPIGDQKKENSCVAWSQVYYQFTYEAARLNKWNVEQDGSKVFSPKYVWNYLNDGENKGLEMGSCYDFLKEQGSLRWNEFPQNQSGVSFDWYMGANEEITTTALRNALKTRVSQRFFYNFAKTDISTPITGNKDAHLTHMKQLLNEGHVLSISTQCKVNGTENNIVLSNGERGIIAGEVNLNEKGEVIGHALTIVGYNDNISYDLNGNGSIESFEQGAFLAANSWGTNAAEHNNGYIWIMYDALNKTSNVSDLNKPKRRCFIEANRYWYMEVENYTPKRMVEVTLEQRYRNELKVSLYTARTLNSSKDDQYTFLNFIGGEKSFDGGNNGRQTRTFVFAYEDEEDIDNKIFGIKVEDATGRNNTETTVKKIRWIDGNGKVLKTLNPQETFDFEIRSYYYGIPVKSITLSKTSSTLYKGETEQLKATVSPENATVQDVEWTSSNPSVVRVDIKSGKVTYVGIGTAIVKATATDGSGVSASCTYRITDDYHDTYDKAFLIAMHTKTSGAINTSGDVDFFKFTPTTTGMYLIYTTGSTDTMGYLYDASQKLLVQNNDASLSGKNFALQYTLTAGKTYYIKVSGNGTKTGAYTLNVSKDFYEASLAGPNQDARRVQMNAEAATALTTLKLTIGSKAYTLNRPASGNLDTTVNGVHFKVTFQEKNNGLSTIWIIEARIPATTTSGGDAVSFDFSKGTVKNVKSTDLLKLIAYDSAIKTGVDTRAEDSLKQLLATMKQSGNTLEVHNWDDTLVNVTSIVKAATGMKIIERDNSGWIMKIHYLVVFGDVIGGEIANMGDGKIDSKDQLAILKSNLNLIEVGSLVLLAADVDHDGEISSKDALLVNKYALKTAEINQDYLITTVPEDCYYQNPVTF